MLIQLIYGIFIFKIIESIIWNNEKKKFRYDNHNRNYAYKSLFPISQTNANLVRIVWGLNPNGMDENQLKKIIERTIELKMIPMIEIHDATGIIV